jgi:hypothetical protein
VIPLPAAPCGAPPTLARDPPDPRSQARKLSSCARHHRAHHMERTHHVRPMPQPNDRKSSPPVWSPGTRLVARRISSPQTAPRRCVVIHRLVVRGANLSTKRRPRTADFARDVDPLQQMQRCYSRVSIIPYRLSRRSRPATDRRRRIAQFSSTNFMPAFASSRVTSLRPSAAPGVQTPPPVWSRPTSRARHSALSAIIFDVEP